jgi:hypothetical protein
MVSLAQKRLLVLVDEPAALQVDLLAALLQRHLLQLLADQLAVGRAVVQAQAPMLEALRKGSKFEFFSKNILNSSYL